MSLFVGRLTLLGSGLTEASGLIGMWENDGIFSVSYLGVFLLRDESFGSVGDSDVSFGEDMISRVMRRRAREF